VDSEGTSELALGEKGAERLLGRGHLAARLEGEADTVYAQVPFADPTMIQAAVKAIARQCSGPAVGHADGGVPQAGQHADPAHGAPVAVGPDDGPTSSRMECGVDMV
jgi:hypothetical protein